MLEKQPIQIEYRIVDDADLPPLVIRESKEHTPVITLNIYHTVWLSLMRATIPGITNSLQDKLNELCNTYLRDRLRERDYI